MSRCEVIFVRFRLTDASWEWMIGKLLAYSLHGPTRPVQFSCGVERSRNCCWSRHHQSWLSTQDLWPSELGRVSDSIISRLQIRFICTKLEAEETNSDAWSSSSAVSERLIHLVITSGSHALHRCIIYSECLQIKTQWKLKLNWTVSED